MSTFFEDYEIQISKKKLKKRSICDCFAKSLKNALMHLNAVHLKRTGITIRLQRLRTRNFLKTSRKNDHLRAIALHIGLTSDEKEIATKLTTCNYSIRDKPTERARSQRFILSQQL